MSVGLDVRDLMGSPGAQRAVHLAEAVDGLSTELARVPSDRPIDADLLLQSVVEGILISGRLSGVLEGSCARCLRPIRRDFDAAVQEVFRPGAGGEEEEYPLADGELDLEPMIRDVVVLAMPFAPLCRPDCLGLCERCGGDRNLSECTCPAEVADPRWRVLGELGLNLDLDDDRGEWPSDN